MSPLWQQGFSRLVTFSFVIFSSLQSKVCVTTLCGYGVLGQFPTDISPTDIFPTDFSSTDSSPKTSHRWAVPRRTVSRMTFPGQPFHRTEIFFNQNLIYRWHTKQPKLINFNKKYEITTFVKLIYRQIKYLQSKFPRF